MISTGHVFSLQYPARDRGDVVKGKALLLINID